MEFRFKYNSTLKIRRILVDGSHAMINSVLECFDKNTIWAYLKKCWKNVKSKQSMEFVIHICRRHVQKAILRKFIKIYRPEKRQEFSEMLKTFKKWLYGFLNASDLESFHRRVLEIIALTSTKSQIKGIENIIQNLGKETDHTRIFLEI